MKALRRFDIRNTYYFITVVTLYRKPILTENIDIFWKSWKSQELFAWVVLPEHFHAILWIKEQSISKLLHGFKIRYYHERARRSGKGKIWQNRFWDHIIRGQEDMSRHLDYIHYNPVKHELANDPFLYEYSSLGLFYKQGFYQRDWGVRELPIFEGEFGE
jgi:putative transposase